MPDTQYSQAPARVNRLRTLRAGMMNPPEARVASVSRAYTVRGEGRTAGQLAARLATVLQELSAVTRQGGALVGHLKGLITFDDGSTVALSVVRDGVGQKAEGFDPLAPVGRFKLAATAIVYNCSRDELSRLLNLGLAVGFPNEVCTLLTEPKKPLTINMFQSSPSTRPAQ